MRVPTVRDLADTFSWPPQSRTVGEKWGRMIILYAGKRKEIMDTE